MLSGRRYHFSQLMSDHHVSTLSTQKLKHNLLTFQYFSFKCSVQNHTVEHLSYITDIFQHNDCYRLKYLKVHKALKCFCFFHLNQLQNNVYFENQQRRGTGSRRT